MDSSQGKRAGPGVRTRILIISDTHAMEFTPKSQPEQYADVAIHCGDLTEESKMSEFRTSIQLLKEINAPLKLVIAGNHDFTLDIPIFKDKVGQVEPPLDPALVVKEYGDYGEARALFEDVKSAGIMFLDEGNHRFTLQNNASLSVYASPFTPSLGDWGFQYPPQQGRQFCISTGTDIVITHGPPRGMMDYTASHQRAGCPDLFAAVARARPRIHCFGHIHEGWGAKLVTWRDTVRETPTHFTAIDNDKSTLIDNLATLRPSTFDTPETASGKRKRLEAYHRDKCHTASFCSGDTNPLKSGAQTLFVNAAIQGTHENYPLQLPWLVDIELPKAR